MAVYTAVPFEAAADLVTRLNIGTLTELEGCKGGIENTNYFADTTRARYVLTLFERLSAEQLPFYLRLMQHLAARGIPVPDPQADAHGEILHQVGLELAVFFHVGVPGGLAIDEQFLVFG